MQAFDVAVGLRAPGADLAVRDAIGQAASELAATELAAVVAEHALKAPAGVLQFCGDAGVPAPRVRDRRSRWWADDEVGPRERAVGVDRGDLPDRALRAMQAPDEAAVKTDQLAGTGCVDVQLGRRLSRRFVRRAVTGDERQAPGARVEPTPAQRLETPLGLTASPPHSGRASCAPMRLGPNPGLPSANATIRCSITGESWLGICGRRRSRGRSISRPERSTIAFQR